MTTQTDVVFANRGNVIDDGCDYTAVILWQMNQRARAISRSAYIPRPAPIQVTKPRELTIKKTRRRTESTRYQLADTLPTESLIAAMTGRWLSSAALMDIIKTQYPQFTITSRALAMRINSMLESPSVDIEKRHITVKEYKLNSVDPVYLERSKRSGGK